MWVFQYRPYHRMRMNEHPATSFDAQLDALGHVDRRRLLLALLEADIHNDLPVAIGQVEDDDAAHSVLLSMHHVHVPKLDRYGFVDANLDHHAVTTGPRFESIRPLLELLAANSDRWPDDWVTRSQREVTPPRR